MSLYFPQAHPHQIAILQSLDFDIKSIPLTIHHEPFLISKLTDQLIARAATKVKVATPSVPKGVILATHTVILYRNHLFEIPKFKMDALEMLQTFVNHGHELVTGWSIQNMGTGHQESGSSTTKVYFRPVSKESLVNYVNDHSVTNHIGGYSPQDPFVHTLIKRLSGSLPNFLYRLPLDQIYPLLVKPEFKLN